MLSSLPTRPRLLVHGHRGCRGLRPENTLPAFLHAIALGVDVLELDVVISEDHQVIVAHDPWLPAHLGTGPVGELIAPAHEQRYNLYQLPYAVIRECAVGLWPPPQFPEQQPVHTYRPLLCEVLAASRLACQQIGRPPVAYSVEIKCDLIYDNLYHPGPEEFARLVLDVVLQSDVANLVTILSFDPRVLQAVRQLVPALPVCFLIENYPLTLDAFNLLGFVPEALGPDFHLLSAEAVIQFKVKYPALRIIPWTVNEYADLQQVLKWQVDGITTDYPNRLLSPNNL